MNKKKFAVVLIIILIIISYKYFDLGSYLTLESLKSQREVLRQSYNDNMALFIIGFSLIYITSTAISLPGATILTLSSGAIFGPILGTIVASASSNIGAALAFLVARYLLRDSLEAKYKDQTSKFNEGIKENAINYLLFLRLVPVFPFFVINLAMGLTRISIITFVGASIIGMLPGTFVYVYAGNQLSNINSLKDIASPGMLSAFALLGVLALIPVGIKKIQAKKSLKKTGEY